MHYLQNFYVERKMQKSGRIIIRAGQYTLSKVHKSSLKYIEEIITAKNCSMAFKSFALFNLF